MITLNDPSLDEVVEALNSEESEVEVNEKHFDGGVLEVPSGTNLFLSHCTGHVDSILAFDSLVDLRQTTIGIGSLLCDILYSLDCTLHAGVVKAADEAEIDETYLDALHFTAKELNAFSTDIEAKWFDAKAVYMDSEVSIVAPSFNYGQQGRYSWQYSALSAMLKVDDTVGSLIDWELGKLSRNHSGHNPDWEKAGKLITAACRTFQEDFDEVYAE